MRWCIYALGGGLGHLVRSLGLARAAIARGHHVTLLANTASATLLPVAKELGSQGAFIKIPASFDRAQVTAFIQHTLHQHTFDVLIVDTFPRGLAGELAELLPALSAKKVLVHRDLNPRYVEQANLTQLVNQYDVLLSPGELGPLAHRNHARFTTPWLIRDFDELLDQSSSWEQLRIERTDRPVIAVIAAGFPAEIQAMQTLAQRLTKATKDRANIRLIALDRSADTPDCPAINLWPMLATIRGIDLLIGAGGYNTVWEARATQTPLIAINRTRLYDLQESRLSDLERVPDESAAFNHAMIWAETNGNQHRPEIPPYENGVHAAVQALTCLSGGKSSRR
ncbi:MAG: hypothetical protein NT013_29205 [Planctomycetia bacterium]|nr:hypothetical protein [Planctomycetia bacterium]